MPQLTLDTRNTGSIAILGPRTGVGGPTSFTLRLTRYLETSGFTIHSSARPRELDAVLLVSATRHVGDLARARARGVRIVQRLDGKNWRHRVERRPLRHKLRASSLNLLIEGTSRFFVDHIVFQSNFASTLWPRLAEHVPSSVVYNAVDPDLFRPAHREQDPSVIRIICVEGEWESDDATVAILRGLTSGLADSGSTFSVTLCGQTQPAFLSRVAGFPGIKAVGPLAPHRLLDELHRSDLMVSTEINPACPNAVIEGLAVGLPVVAFSTGALPELVPTAAGLLLPYNADQWRLEPPDEPQRLAEAALEVMASLSTYQAAARNVAVTRFALKQQAETYIEILLC